MRHKLTAARLLQRRGGAPRFPDVEQHYGARTCPEGSPIVACKWQAELLVELRMFFSH